MNFYSSDHHYNHNNVINLCNRPYSSIEEMNEDLIEKWNSKVSNDDTVYYLGDFSLSTAALPIVKRLNGRKLLVCGNHDKAFDYGEKKKASLKQRQQLYLDAGFSEILKPNTEITLKDGRRVMLNHFPFLADSSEYEVRYKEYRPIDRGQWLLHGHVHNLFIKRGRQINVGVDRHDFFPVSEDKILEIMDHKGDIF